MTLRNQAGTRRSARRDCSQGGCDQRGTAIDAKDSPFDRSPLRLIRGLYANAFVSSASFSDPLTLVARIGALRRPSKQAATLAYALSALALTAACGSLPASNTAQNDRPVPENDKAQRQVVVGLRKHVRDAGRMTAQAAAESGAKAEGREAREDAVSANPAREGANLRALESLMADPMAESGGVTKLVAFDSAPFPYHGMQPGRGPFLNVERGGQKGHRAYNGQILWENSTFSDRRALVHVPAGFDPSKPSVLMVFFHGFGATIERDVRDRYLVPAQVSRSGANAVLVAPQFAVDARDGSAGHFWEPGGFTRFLDEAAQRLADIHGGPDAVRHFRNMPVVLVAYSGGFLPAAYALRDVERSGRVRGVMLLDAAYGELGTFAHWASKERSGFFVSACTTSTFNQNARLKMMLAANGVPYSSDTAHVGRGVTFFNTGSQYSHRDYVTQAWVNLPITDLLSKMPGVEQRSIGVASQENIRHALVAPEIVANRSLVEKDSGFAPSTQ